MDEISAALGDSARWRMVELLAERPRAVGELAELTGLRQPQATKHLQTLARAGLVAVFPLGQRRVYALETDSLQAFSARLRQLLETAEAHAGERDVIARYRAAIDREAVAADRDRWADGREFAFERTFDAGRDRVWRYWTDADLLGSWWAPKPLTIAECVLEPRTGGRVVLEYRDEEGRRYRSEGQVLAADEPGALVFDLAVLDAAGATSFTGRYDLSLAAVPRGTRLRLGLTITETTIGAAPFIAGIETGWGQVLDNLAELIGAHTDDEGAES